MVETDEIRSLTNTINSLAGIARLTAGQRQARTAAAREELRRRFVAEVLANHPDAHGDELDRLVAVQRRLHMTRMSLAAAKARIERAAQRKADREAAELDEILGMGGDE